MTRRFLYVGLITAFCVAGFSETSEAGHHHRRARKAAGQNCGASPCATVNTGCSTCSSDGYAYPSGQSYGATSYGSPYGSNYYGNSGDYGNYGMPAGQGYISTNVGGNLMGGRLLGR
jgi:hypothetical protein